MAAAVAPHAAERERFVAGEHAAANEPNNLEAPKNITTNKQKWVIFRPPLTPPQESPNADLREGQAVEGTGKQPGAPLGDPPSFDPSIYNDCLTILTRQPEVIEDTCVPDCLSVLRFAPAIEIIGRTSG
jgi:hypothetical protein